MKLCIVFQTAVALYLALSPAQSLPLVEINNTTEEKMSVVFQRSSSNRVVEAGTATYVLFQQRARQIIVQHLLMFQQVWGRSFCRTIEKLVEVVQEYPTEVEHIYSPSCVPLVRCAGCCGDENLECHPTQTTNVTMQLLKIRPSEPDQEYVEMMFVEHQTCECRVRKPIVKVERRRQRGRGRKRKERQKTRDCDRCPPRR